MKRTLSKLVLTALIVSAVAPAQAGSLLDNMYVRATISLSLISAMGLSGYAYLNMFGLNKRKADFEKAQPILTKIKQKESITDQEFKFLSDGIRALNLKKDENTKHLRILNIYKQAPTDIDETLHLLTTDVYPTPKETQADYFAQGFVKGSVVAFCGFVAALMWKKINTK